MRLVPAYSVSKLRKSNARLNLEMQLGKDAGLVLESLVEPVEKLRLQAEIALVALQLGDLFWERRLRHTIINIRMADINFIVLWCWCVGREKR